MRERLSDYQEEYGDLYNLEATPAESTSYRLAKHDRKQWPDIRTAGKEGDTPYYTNSSHLPVDFSKDIFDALDIQDELQTLYTSGGGSGEKDCGKLQTSLLYAFSHLFSLPGSRIYFRGAFYLPHLRQKSGGLQQDYRILSACSELE